MASRAAVQPVNDADVALYKHVPPAAKERYWALVAARELAFDRVLGNAERVAELRADKGRAERIAQELETAYEKGRLIKTVPDLDYQSPFSAEKLQDIPRLQAAQNEVQRLRDRIAKANEIHAALSAEVNIFASLGSAAEGYFAATKKIKLRLADTITPDVPRGETVIEAINRVRDRIDALKRERRSIDKGPGTIEEAKVKMREIVGKLAATGRPNVSPLFTRSPRIEWPRWSTGLTVGDTFVAKIDGASMFAWVHKDALIAALEAEIESYGAAIEGEPLTGEAREARLADIETATLDLNFQEQALLDRAAAEGLSILPRADADIRAVLWLAPDSPAPRPNQ